MKRGGLCAGLCVTVIMAITVPFSTAFANRFTSPSYIIDASLVGGSTAGATSSASYQMTSTTGETIVGNASGGSYRIGTGYIAQLENGFELTIQPSGLIAYYSLDEPSGTSAYDTSAGGYTAAATAAPSRIAGKISGGIGPVTASQYLKSTETAAFNTPYVTACAWANKSAAATNPTLIAHDADSGLVNGMWRLGFGTGLYPKSVVQAGGTSYTTTATVAVTTGTWNHICTTYDGTSLVMYVNGVQAGTTTVGAGALPAVNTPLTVGARQTGGEPSTAQAIDEVKVFGRALSADEINAEYVAGNAGTTAGLFAGNILPGVSTQATYDTVVKTDAYGYNLAVSQDRDLTNGSFTIPAVGGSIMSPASWVEGSTKGLGFTLYGTNATAIPAKWSSGASYAAFPATATGFYARSGTQGATKDTLNLRLRLDTSPSQTSGAYSNTVTTTGTIIP